MNALGADGMSDGMTGVEPMVSVQVRLSWITMEEVRMQCGALVHCTL